MVASHGRDATVVGEHGERIHCRLQGRRLEVVCGDRVRWRAGNTEGGTGIVVEVTTAERDRLEAVIADRNSPQKHVWRAKIVLLTADGCGTAEIMQATGKAKTVIWRWQDRFQEEGAAGLWRDKQTRELPAASEIGPGISRELHDVLAGTLERDPAQRLDSLRAVAAWSGPLDPTFLAKLFRV